MIIKEVLGFIMLGFSILLYTQCQPNNNPTPPPGVSGSFTTPQTNFNCWSNSTPLKLAFGVNGVTNTIVTVDITSNVAPQFNYSDELGYQNPDISFSPFLDGCANIRVPESGEYTAVVRFIEGDSNCQPSQGLCWRWYTMQTMPSGFIPNCGNSPLFINQQDPAGFVGTCQ